MLFLSFIISQTNSFNITSTDSQDYSDYDDKDKDVYNVIFEILQERLPGQDERNQCIIENLRAERIDKEFREWKRNNKEKLYEKMFIYIKQGDHQCSSSTLRNQFIKFAFVISIFIIICIIIRIICIRCCSC